VLVVDDNVDAAELLELMLSKAGHVTAVATDALSALDIASRFTPDVAILDIGLPVIDGYELAVRIRGVPNCAKCRLIALTGYGQDHDRRRSLGAGFEQHLVKPVDIARLLRLVEAESAPVASAAP
jgi:CheY-like chemotaxis protein